ncbi:hypothetical protein M758_10G097800 [Ceratodon purpureus]|uniref:BHLH domain-containing protein n=2 Tax=Ceratodon purpureus TaxID=3225 RepID=A0A8T0GLD6_CERPU|nr:hypothetical protein KC19_10G100000 [Ceratodon purpureus]KAG0603485.1 hypothetical protein M758_10G097800 [Ceratodon purpureus]KAG0603488.1 hypothetical protein M758_10G097800 [Ceratodon purpureus]
MCADGMDGPVSTMKQTSHRGTSQSSFSSGMGAVDEEISVMLQSNHANMRQSSLTGVMAPAVSAPLDHLAAYHYAMYPPGYAGNNARPVAPMQRTSPGTMAQGSTGPAHVRPPPVHRGSPPQSRRSPGFNLEEKYVLEAKSEVLDASAMRNGVSYGAVYENSGPSMLHRYHSAPATTFLAEMNEPGHLNNTVMAGLYGDGGLTSISENMDMERVGGNGNTSSYNDYEHYMAPENDFARRLAFPASLCKEEATSGSLLRQSSMPSVGLSHLNTSMLDRMAENGSDKSSSRNSDDNNHLINGYTASMYSQDDYLWKSPTSPAKRQRGLEGESETSSGSADGSTYRNGHHGGLVRHMSLPSPTCGPSSPGVEGNSFSAVPMRTRAKRGCATHPRSIAERVRRTKISERMKRLQDLVPDMDKQTNTSDMLDETVEYVKSLQRKVQELNETVAQLQAAAAKHSNSNTNLELRHGNVAMDASG